MGTRIILIVALFLSATIFSCNKEKENILTATKDNIQGNWKQNYPQDNFKYYNPPAEYELISFKNDSFYMTVRSRVELIEEVNCFQTTWLSYIKGVYSLNNSKVYFDGVYATSSFGEKTSGCFGVGSFKDSFKTALNNNRLFLYSLFPGEIPEEWKNVKMDKIN